MGQTDGVNAGADIEKELAEKLQIGPRVIYTFDANSLVRKIYAALLAEAGERKRVEAERDEVSAHLLEIEEAAQKIRKEMPEREAVTEGMTTIEFTRSIIRSAGMYGRLASKQMRRAESAEEERDALRDAYEIANENRGVPVSMFCETHLDTSIGTANVNDGCLLCAAELRASTEAERARKAEEMHHAAECEVDLLESRVAALQAQLETALRLRNYHPEHKAECKAISKRDNHECDCGLTELVAALSQLPTPAQEKK